MVLFEEEQRERHPPCPEPVGAARGGLHAGSSTTATHWPQAGDWESIRQTRVQLPAQLLLKTPSNGRMMPPTVRLLAR